MGVWVKKLGKELSKIRDERGEKQDAFAARIGVSRTTLSQIENGSRGYSVKPLLTVLAGLTDNPVDKLLELAGKLNDIDPVTIRTCTMVMELASDPERRDLTAEVVEALLRQAQRKTGQ
jgi:transcriptional regulator with XRE-family HTH domain